MKQITDKELIDAFHDFDKELEIDEDKLTGLSKKQRSELYLAIRKVLTYREDFPPDLADAIQQLAKQSVEKQPIQKGDLWPSFALELNEDGIILESGEIIEPDDELFPLAKVLSGMDNEEIIELIDNLATVVVNCGQEVMVKMLQRRLDALEKARSKKQEPKNLLWPSITKRD